jgi:hypothetical protein
MKQNAVGYEYVCTLVNGRQLIVQHTAGPHEEVGDQFLAVRTGNLQVQLRYMSAQPVKSKIMML